MNHHCPIYIKYRLFLKQNLTFIKSLRWSKTFYFNKTKPKSTKRPWQNRKKNGINLPRVTEKLQSRKKESKREGPSVFKGHFRIGNERTEQYVARVVVCAGCAIHWRAIWLTTLLAIYSPISINQLLLQILHFDWLSYSPSISDRPQVAKGVDFHIQNHLKKTRIFAPRWLSVHRQLWSFKIIC